MAAVTEDEIIRRRLLFDGDGTGDDKRIATIIRTIIQWSVTKCDEDERNMMYQKIISMLHHCEYSFRKHHLSYLMNIKERQHYESLYEHVEKQIEEAKDEIKFCKEELKRAKVIRKNKQEYDALAKIIEKHPDRKQIGCENAKLEEDIYKLKESKSLLIEKLEMRQKQFLVLIYSIQLLQEVLQEDHDVTNENKPPTIEVMDLT
ncbi:THO complex subunit 7 homolog isoform X1 [Hydra vulgaris]|nr:THO complex subunit 7 homolog [Hydra vulgaris]